MDLDTSALRAAAGRLVDKGIEAGPAEGLVDLVKNGTDVRRRIIKDRSRLMSSITWQVDLSRAR